MNTPSGVRSLDTFAPIQTILVESQGERGIETEIIRRFPPGAAAACRLCDRCTAQQGRDGQTLCVVRISGRIDSTSAPAFSTRTPRLHVWIG